MSMPAALTNARRSLTGCGAERWPANFTLAETHQNDTLRAVKTVPADQQVMKHSFAWLIKRLSAVLAALCVTIGAVSMVFTTPASASIAPTLRPPMGWNGFNSYFGNGVSEDIVLAQAQRLVSTGLVNAGYTYVNLDSGWADARRDANGNVTYDKGRFPHGIKWLAAQVHAMNPKLKFGIYTDVGTGLCGYDNGKARPADDPISEGTNNGLYGGGTSHMKQDVRTFSSWGVDFVKVDSCDVPWSKWPSLKGQGQKVLANLYTEFRNALNQPGIRSMVYAICVFNEGRAPQSWAPPIGSMWRTASDIANSGPTGATSWSDVIHNFEFRNYPTTVRPGHWQDADFMSIGVRSTAGHPARLHWIEQQAQMAMWAMMASPLITGTDLVHANTATLSLLKDPTLISVDQDPLGHAARMLSASGGGEVWTRPLVNGRIAVMLFNRGAARSITVSTQAKQLAAYASTRYTYKAAYPDSTGAFGTTIAAHLAPHQAKIFVLTPVGTKISTPQFSFRRTTDARVKWGRRHAVGITGVVRGATTGRVQLIVNDKLVAAYGAVSRTGQFTIRWMTRANTPLGAKHFKVYYNGADPKLLAGRSTTHATVWVVQR